MRLVIDYGLLWFIEEGIVSALTIPGVWKKVKVGPGELGCYTKSGIEIELPVEITSVRICEPEELSDVEVWATGNPNLESLIDGLITVKPYFTDRDQVTFVMFRRD